MLLLFGMTPERARERMTHMHPPPALELADNERVPLTVSWGVAPLQPDVDAALRDADARRTDVFAGDVELLTVSGVYGEIEAIQVLARG
ncbi:MAG TPA: hypothetical protein VKT72_13195 [Candidatus Baltobacteraceae bacterium]|nr:hypothetical protein [Candidatus Baltobacteraceae bacterium]